MTTSPVTLVLLARATEEARRLLYYVFAPSFMTNWGKVEHFRIICPAADIPLLQPLADRLGASFQPDEEFANITLLPPYQRQIAMKLMVADTIATPYYLTLDCDCLFLPGGEAAMFDEAGKPYLHTNRSQNYYHRYWVENCNQLTGNSRFVEPMTGFTPQIMITSAVRDLCATLTEQAGADLVTALVRWEKIYRNRTAPVQVNVEAIPHTVLKPALVSDVMLRMHHAWTEYALYWSYILKHSLETTYSTALPLCDKFYMGKYWASYVGHTIPPLSESELEFDLLAEGFFNYQAPLAVIQSTAGAEWSRVASVMARHGLIDPQKIIPCADEPADVLALLDQIQQGERLDPLPKTELV